MLNSKLNSGLLYDYIKQFDIFCMSETKSKKGVKITNFTCFDLEIENKPKTYPYHGIHGVTVYIKDKLAASCHLITSEDFLCSSVIGIKINENFILGALYLPHESSKHFYEDTFEDLTSDIHIVKDHNLPIMLMGDFNSRTGTKNDIMLLDQNEYLNTYKLPNIINMLNNSKIPLERKSLDTKTNNNGKKLIEMCKLN